MTKPSAGGRELAARGKERVLSPVGPALEEPTGDPQVWAVVWVPPPHRAEDPVRRPPIGRGRHRERVESVRHDEIQRRRTGEEEQIQVPAAFHEAAGEGHRSGRVAEALGMDREVPTEFLHRATHCPLPQRPSDATSALPGTARFRGPARAAYGRRYIAGGS